MKFRVYMKDADALHDSITEAVNADLKESGLPKDEQDALRELRYEKAIGIASEWFEYSEYATIEIDTEAGTARVVPVEDGNV